MDANYGFTATFEHESIPVWFPGSEKLNGLSIVKEYLQIFEVWKFSE